MINRTELNIQERLVREVAGLRRELEALKARQLMGLDNLLYDKYDFTVSTTCRQTTISISGCCSSALVRDYLRLEIGVVIYINNDNDPDYHWAHGASVIGDSDLRAFRFAGPWFDPDWSDFTLDPPRKAYMFKLQNTGTATKTFYIHLSITYIKVTPGTGSEGST